MIDYNCYEKNINVLKIRFPHIAKKIESAARSHNYSDIQYSKTGIPIPCFKNGNLLHSKYNPEKEAERFFYKNEGFVLFCGLGSGVHIRYFLNNFKDNYCAVSESNLADLKNLLHKMDFTDIFSNSKFTLLPCLEENEFETELIKTYIPVLHGNFEVKFLRPWENYYKDFLPRFSEKIQNALTKIKGDTATQARFGKIWMRNILLNLKTASEISPEFPKTDASKTAYILGAGPSLESALDEIKEKRERFVLFATDTAFQVLTAQNITPDFFISIDPQTLSYSHCFKPFNTYTTGIFDLCANPLTVRTFLQNGNGFFFTAGGHPFTQYAAALSPFPYCDTSTGTVAGAAKYAALALQFKTLQFAGLDFAYTDGKAYSRGTYLSKNFFKSAYKNSPAETQFCELMFRTPTEKKIKSEKITYTTELLDSYSISFNEKKDVAEWRNADFKNFPYTDFIYKLKQDSKKNDINLKTAFLPYLTFKSKMLYTKKNNFLNLELALSDILEYTIK